MRYSVRFNGKEYEVEVERMEDDFRALTRAEISKGDTGVPVQAGTKPSAAPSEAAAPAGECRILSPMPGTVLEVKASAGQTVKAGDTVVVIEAMKMENEIVAPQDGVIVSVPVKKGDVLETDTVLAVMN